MSLRDGLLTKASALRQQGLGWSGLPGDALAFVLAGTVGEGRCVVVVDEPDAAERLARGLRFFLPEGARVEVFPGDDVRPYDGFSPSPDVIAQRTRVLHRLERGDGLIVVVPVRALMQRMPTAASRQAGTHRIAVGDTVDRDALIRSLSVTGYLAAGRVDHPGTFAVRGDVVDVWSPGIAAPRRLDFFDDEIEEIRVLDPRNLRPLKKVKRLTLLPAREDRIDAPALERLQHMLGAAVTEQRRGVSLRRQITEELRAGIRSSAIEDYLPALVETAPPLELLGVDDLIVVHPTSVAASARDTWEKAHRRWSEMDEQDRPLITPDARFVAPDELLAALQAGHPVYEMGGTEQTRSLGAVGVDGMAVRGADLGPTAVEIRKLLSKHVRVALVAPDARRGQMLEELLEPHGVILVGRASPYDLRPGEAALLVGDLPRGFVAREAGWALIPSSALFGGADSEARRRAHDMFDEQVSSLSELKEGDLVVHRLHGIGRYLGLQRLDVGQRAQDFVKLEYRDGDLLYVPATALGQLSNYAASRSGVEVRLDRLGGQTWAARKGKVRDTLLGAAQELLKVHARRELATRPAHPPVGPLYKAFVSRFPHMETPDQARAILDIHEDLSEDVPMDRLLCGDVGFGKTEVAMRAAMRVVEGGQQVAFLCPTTVLAFQHEIKFRERFEPFDVRIGALSRFSSAAEAREVKAALLEGRIDVVVGTHALLGRDVRFADLGLLVVDEEHRFGVKQKARFKKMRAQVDILSMSATPIPRTLQMALGGLRQMSVMATPPEDRLSVRTGVARMTETRVRDAIQTEIARGGQVYFIHNRIESIEGIRKQLEGWVPDARFRVAHGQMSGEDIEAILLDFMHGQFDVLVCTAIVESGVDLPNVNTMLIHRADRFGLSQLYQLRGRVGRSSVRGNCILLTPETMTRDARKRLQVLVDNTSLGSGFSVASADLELRGGGNVLGEAQSGSIDKVGYNVWVELLEEAVHAARGEAERARIEPEVDVPVGAFIPENLVPDMTERLAWYRRLSDVSRPQDAEVVLDDLERECGPLPAEVHHLAGKVQTTLLCRELGILAVRWMRVRATLELHPTSRLTRAMLDEVAAEHPKRFTVGAGPGGVPVFEARFTPKEAERPYRYLRWLLARFERAVAGG